MSLERGIYSSLSGYCRLWNTLFRGESLPEGNLSPEVIEQGTAGTREVGSISLSVAYSLMYTSGLFYLFSILVCCDLSHCQRGLAKRSLQGATWWGQVYIEVGQGVTAGSYTLSLRSLSSCVAICSWLFLVRWCLSQGKDSRYAGRCCPD